MPTYRLDGFSRTMTGPSGGQAAPVSLLVAGADDPVRFGSPAGAPLFGTFDALFLQAGGQTFDASVLPATILGGTWGDGGRASATGDATGTFLLLTAPAQGPTEPTVEYYIRLAGDPLPGPVPADFIDSGTFRQTPSWLPPPHADQGLRIGAAIDLGSLAAAERLEATVGAGGAVPLLAPVDGGSVIGTQGDDLIFGGPGDDSLEGSVGADTIFGGAGDDRLDAGGGGAVVQGPGGWPQTSGARIEGGAGNDTIHGGAAHDWLFGGDGDDEIHAGPADPAAAGNARGLLGSNLWGGAGDDTLIGGSGNDILRGDGGDNLLIGNGGRNALEADTGNDRIFAGALGDTIRSGAGDDTIHGGAGADQIYAYGSSGITGDGDNLIFGGGGNDTIDANNGRDTIAGGVGRDLIHGRGGDDFLNGGWGNDTLSGGGGADRFFHAGVAGHGTDWVTDFGVGDQLVLGGNPYANPDLFQVNFAHAANPNLSGAGDVMEAFVILRPTGQILWALTDGAALDGVTIRTPQQVWDLTF